MRVFDPQLQHLTQDAVLKQDRRPLTPRRPRKRGRRAKETRPARILREPDGRRQAFVQIEGA